MTCPGLVSRHARPQGLVDGLARQQPIYRLQTLNHHIPETIGGALTIPCARCRGPGMALKPSMPLP